MKKYKICVYAITKNEEKHVDKWYNSMKEADEIYVLDTGSTDNTVEKLKENNINVTQEIITPWRFDVARNKSLELVPIDTDICVCTDLDELFTPGWREELESVWDEQTDLLSYNYIWNFDSKGNPGTTFYIQKIHSRNNFHWINPVHEVITKINQNDKITKTTDNITLNHHQDTTKSRTSYLPLLELSVEENPQNDRNVHYLGREYMYYEEYHKAIKTLHNHLKLKSATWKDERAASMRFIARSYKKLNYLEEAELWFKNSIKEAPYLREGYIELAFLYNELKQYQQSINYIEESLKITNKPKTYINESFCYNETPYDLLSINYYNINNIEKAINNIKLAIEINPNNERLNNNLEYFQSLL